MTCRKLRNQMQYLSQTMQKEKDDLEKLKATQVGGDSSCRPTL